MADDPPEVLRTTAGDFPIGVCRVRVGGREWAVRHTRAVLSQSDESAYLDDPDRHPYGVVLWPAALALAHEVATRAGEFAGRSVLELGAGVGLPGLVAAGVGARVVQTDRSELALALCRLNGERNGAAGLECRLADWEAWSEAGRYDWVLGSDVLYGATLHADLRRIFEGNLSAGGRVLVSDPFRSVSLHLLEELEASGWRVVMSRWSIGDGPSARPVGVFELTPPP
ncbi:MAG: methyltransferase domain-containing protein [Gemmataceae bacterium]|nr:methyltransferase domain-containing protein [Gemmataceae bacterium]